MSPILSAAIMLFAVLMILAVLAFAFRRPKRFLAAQMNSSIVLILFAFAIVSGPHAAGAIVAALVVGAILGYLFRNAIAKDLSSIQVRAWITKLEAVAEKDLASMKTITTSVANDLRKVL